MGLRVSRPPVDGGAGGAPGGNGDEEVEKVGIIDVVRTRYEEIVNCIIRPPRAEYDMRELGPAAFDFHGRHFIRDDLVLVNPRGQRLHCSHWREAPGPTGASPKASGDGHGTDVVTEGDVSVEVGGGGGGGGGGCDGGTGGDSGGSTSHGTDGVSGDAVVPKRRAVPCVVYLHGNSSCRIAALEGLQVVLEEGMSCFAFDFAGSGHSDGEWVTLGWFERDDVAVVVDHLRSQPTVSTIALWGRSMGAATALLHSHRDPSIAAIILDSPFASLRQLADEMVEVWKSQMNMKMPGFVVSGVIKLVRSSVRKKACFDINDLSPIDHVDQAFIPALFCAAEGDDFIRPHHIRAIYNKYAGDKNFILVPGAHNSPRSRSFYDSAAIFLRNAMLMGDGDADREAADAMAACGIPRGEHQSLLSGWHAGRNVHNADDFVDAEEEMMRRAIAMSLLAVAGGEPPLPGVATKDEYAFGEALSHDEMAVWPCPECTYLSPLDCVRCQMCGHARPELHIVDEPTSSEAEFRNGDDGAGVMFEGDWPDLVDGAAAVVGAHIEGAGPPSGGLPPSAGHGTETGGVSGDDTGSAIDAGESGALPMSDAGRDSVPALESSLR